MMCAEEVHEIAQKIGMPSYMFDTDTALFWLSRFAKEAESARPEERQKGGMSMLMDADGTRDTRRFEWLEANNTLHKSVEILYVVDGYEVQVMHEDGVTELSPPYRGATIRAAIDEALLHPPQGQR